MPMGEADSVAAGAVAILFALLMTTIDEKEVRTKGDDNPNEVLWRNGERMSAGKNSVDLCLGSSSISSSPKKWQSRPLISPDMLSAGTNYLIRRTVSEAQVDDIMLFCA